MKPQLYIIAGCNGAGKTTASFTILPEVLDCKEFVNADEIAKGLSPFQPETVAFQAGRIMLTRVKELLAEGKTFAFETTLATKSYHLLVKEAQARGYVVSLLFFWLNSPTLAIDRVRTRVMEGGHNIPPETILRRYHGGLRNLSEIFLPIVDLWTVIDNSGSNPEIVAFSKAHGTIEVIDPAKFNKIVSDETGRY